MRKQYKSSIIKNHKITTKNFFDGVPLNSLLSYFQISHHKYKKALWEYPVTNDA